MNLFKLSAIFFSLVLLDQLSKYIIRVRQLADGGFYICNKNIAFGINFSYFLFFLLVFFILIILSLISNSKYKISNQCQISKFKKFKIIISDLICNLKFVICNCKANLVALILIGAGALANMVDRLYLGCVIDFIDLKFWPVFNLADVYITIGSVIIIYNIFRTTDSH